MSTYFPKSVKNRAKAIVQYTKSPLFYSRWRPSSSLFNFTKNRPTLSRGCPVFHTVFDTLNRKATGLRRYRVKTVPQEPKTDYTPENCHNMNHRFRFELNGVFNDKCFESELQSHCNQLSLVGWIKCRQNFAIGHVSFRNVIATSQMKRWMEICGTRHANITRVTFSEENYSITQLDYSDLTVVKDYRRPQKKLQHDQAVKEKMQMLKLLTESRSNV
ncbi:hypothetical protein BEWA_019070 [Theileria equi strain WA]|uniref:Acylphosphatase-like domain-containing protein n=1 Tax=Theileria equi strain WA TaxID=1537102 RepID=L0ATT8_THEEQ|nr:hypothetical protein BEWA_019070 [Theileria equi strain WA]AFZ79062.1 hypothetical protein BEWA_019070 [Theileria equi strain WA]|eukprot:XP_004828728.1 hypothetical protein BEWA_019070 [Theileria equi strain WA]